MINVTIIGMENAPWNNKDISLDKKTLDVSGFDTNINKEEVRGVVKKQ